MTITGMTLAAFLATHLDGFECATAATIAEVYGRLGAPASVMYTRDRAMMHWLAGREVNGEIDGYRVVLRLDVWAGIQGCVSKRTHDFWVPLRAEH